MGWLFCIFQWTVRVYVFFGDRFSQHITTVKPLEFPSVFHPPGSLPFEALHIFF